MGWAGYLEAKLSWLSSLSAPLPMLFLPPDSLAVPTPSPWSAAAALPALAGGAGAAAGPALMRLSSPSTPLPALPVRGGGGGLGGAAGDVSGGAASTAGAPAPAAPGSGAASGTGSSSPSPSRWSSPASSGGVSSSELDQDTRRPLGVEPGGGLPRPPLVCVADPKPNRRRGLGDGGRDPPRWACCSRATATIRRRSADSRDELRRDRSPGDSSTSPSPAPAPVMSVRSPPSHRTALHYRTPFAPPGPAFMAWATA